MENKIKNLAELLECTEAQAQFFLAELLARKIAKILNS